MLYLLYLLEHELYLFDIEGHGPPLLRLNVLTGRKSSNIIQTRGSMRGKRSVILTEIDRKRKRTELVQNSAYRGSSYRQNVATCICALFASFCSVEGEGVFSFI
jgi:hypothetical protein